MWEKMCCTLVRAPRTLMIGARRWARRCERGIVQYWTMWMVVHAVLYPPPLPLAHHLAAAARWSHWHSR